MRIISIYVVVDKLNHVRVFGLGSDEKVYIWSTSNGQWEFYSRD